MCGIVGYVGHQQALDVVVGGLRRLEYRGYDSAGVAVVDGGALTVRKKAGQAGQPGATCSPSDPLPRAGTGIGHTRWATHGAPDRPQRPPALRRRTGKVAVIHNGIIENFAPLRAELEERGRTVRPPTPTPRSSRTCWPRRCRRRRATSPRRCARCCRGSRAPSPSSPSTPTRPTSSSAPAATPRSSSVSATARTSSASDVVRLHRPHPRGDRARPGPGRRAAPRRRRRSPTSTARRPTGSEYHVDWDASAAEKGGYDYFMLKEIAEQPQAVADTLLGRLGERRRAHPRRGAPVRPGAARHRQDLHHRLRHGLPRRHGRQVRHRALDPHPLRGRAGQRVPLPRPDPRPVDAGHRDLPVRRDDGHADGAAPRPRAGPRVLAICNTNGSTIPRESDAVLYTHAGPEVAVASTKAFLTQLVACYLVGLYLAQVRGMKYGDEVAAVVHDLAAMPEKVEQVLDAMEPVRELARSLVDAPHGALPRPPRRLPGGARGRAQAQGAGLHARRGLRRRRAQARPDRAASRRACRWSSSCRRREGRAVLHDKVVSNIQEVRARGARTIVIAEEGDEAVVPYADHLIRVPASPDAAAAAGDHGAAAGARLRDRRRPGASTSTSRATWPSPSRSSSGTRPGRRVVDALRAEAWTRRWRNPRPTSSG